MLSVRIKKELQKIQTHPVEGILVEQDENNMRHFFAKIAGPKDTPYDGGVFDLELYLTEAYPMEAPRILFRTNVYHPNIDKLGRICLDLLKDKWSPLLQITTLLQSIQVLLSAPNIDDPLDESVAQHWRTNPDDAINKAREWTQKYAM